MFIQFSQRRWLHDFLNYLFFENGIDMIFQNVSSLQAKWRHVASQYNEVLNFLQTLAVNLGLKRSLI